MFDLSSARLANARLETCGAQCRGRRRSWINDARQFSGRCQRQAIMAGLKRIVVAICQWGVVLALSGCSTLLPSSETATVAPWSSFDEALRMFNAITPSKTTTADLKAMGLDPFAGDNVTILNYADLIRRFAVPGTNSLADLDVGLTLCIEAKQDCQGYEIEQRETHHEHTGNFWLDFFNFRRIVTTTGWRFTATVVINRNLVVYKVWSGQPAIREVEDVRNPLGPAQGIGLSNLPLGR
jgi:hypothetical protein